MDDALIPPRAHPNDRAPRSPHRRGPQWRRCERLVLVCVNMDLPAHPCAVRAAVWLCRTLGRVPAPHKKASHESKCMDLINLQLKTILAQDPKGMTVHPDTGAPEPKLVQIARNNFAGRRTGLPLTNWERYGMLNAYRRREIDPDDYDALIDESEVCELLGRSAQDAVTVRHAITHADLRRGPTMADLRADPLAEFEPLRPFFVARSDDKKEHDRRYLLDGAPESVWDEFNQVCRVIARGLIPEYGTDWFAERK